MCVDIMAAIDPVTLSRHGLTASVIKDKKLQTEDDLKKFLDAATGEFEEAAKESVQSITQAPPKYLDMFEQDLVGDGKPPGERLTNTQIRFVDPYTGKAGAEALRDFLERNEKHWETFTSDEDTPDFPGPYLPETSASIDVYKESTIDMYSRARQAQAALEAASGTGPACTPYGIPSGPALEALLESVRSPPDPSVCSTIPTLGETVESGRPVNTDLADLISRVEALERTPRLADLPGYVFRIVRTLYQTLFKGWV